MQKTQMFRSEIDKIDKEIECLLVERFSLTHDLGVYKKINNIEILDTNREEFILNNIKDNRVKEVYRKVLEVSKIDQKQ